MTTRWCTVAWLGVLALGCDGGADRVSVIGATPAHGPLVGGARITISGAGFATDAVAGVRVLIDGRVAPLAAVIDDQTVDVVIPPGRAPGDAEVVVLSGDRNARATGIFAYSAPPTVSDVTPTKVLFSAETTRLTITGSGFLAEEAGPVTVLVDGVPGAEVVVSSDTTLSFIAPPGRPLVEPDVEVVDRRGRATRLRAFRYVPSDRPGLLLFPRFGAFAVFYDPSAPGAITIPLVAGGISRFSAVVRDSRGDYWGMDSGGRWGRIDMKRQVLEGAVAAQGRFPTITKVGDDYLAIDRNSQRIGRFEPATGGFTPLSVAPLGCCGSFGLASDGTSIYVTARAGSVVTIAPFDLRTRFTGAPVPIVGPAGFHVEEMRFFAGTLYAASRTGTLVTIDPRTGATTVLPVNLGRFTAMEVFE